MRKKKSYIDREVDEFDAIEGLEYDLEHLQKTLYNIIYEVFCSQKRNFKISNLKF